MKFRIKYADRIVGLFVILAALALVAGIILLGSRQRWFSRDYRFESVLSSAAGASPGTAIFMRGFQVGKIEEVRLGEQNEVRVRLVIYDTYRPLVRKYSIIELVTSPIGVGTQILFHPGKGEELLEEGALIPEATSPEGEVLIDQELVEMPPKDDTITRLLAGINPLIENVNKTVVTMNRTLTEVNRALAGQSAGPLGQIVNDAAGAVADVRGVIAGADSLVADVDRTVVGVGSQVEEIIGQAETLVAQLGTVMGNVEATTAQLATIAGNVEATTAAIRDPTGLVPRLLDPKGSLKTLLDDKNQLYLRIASALTETERTLKNVQAITASLSSEMPSIAATLQDTRTAIQQAQDVLEGLKNNPLIRGGVPERVQAEPLYRSMRDGGF